MPNDGPAGFPMTIPLGARTTHCNCGNPLGTSRVQVARRAKHGPPYRCAECSARARLLPRKTVAEITWAERCARIEAAAEALERVTALPVPPPASRPPRRHDPTDPECVCDTCDPE